VNTAIREVDPTTLLFWEAATWSHWAPAFDTPLINRLVAGLFTQYPALSWLHGISRYVLGIAILFSFFKRNNLVFYLLILCVIVLLRVKFNLVVFAFRVKYNLAVF
jgi:hypothetical protein